MEFFWLLFAHFLADFPLQGQWLAEMKGKEPLFMTAHCAIWTGMVCLAMVLLGIEITLAKLLFLYIGHHFADWYKCKKYWSTEHMVPFDNDIEWIKPYNARLVYSDQVWHLLQLMVVYFL